MYITKIIRRYSIASPREPYIITMHNVPTGGGVSVPFSDLEKEQIDLFQFLIKNPETTFMIVVSGDSMEGAGIPDGAHCLVDSSIVPVPGDGHSVAVNIDGEELVKKWEIKDGREVFTSRNGKRHDIYVTEHTKCVIQGVITLVLSLPK